MPPTRRIVQQKQGNRPLPQKAVKPSTTDKARLSQRQRRQDKLSASAVTQAGRSEEPKQKPIQDLSKTDKPKPPLHIFPTAGPVGDLRTQTALRHGLTPEAQQELRKTKIRYTTPSTGFGSYYDPNENEIQVMGNPANAQHPESSVLAHEQAHAWWNNRGMEDPAIKNQYMADATRWRNESNLSSPQTQAYNGVDTLVRGGAYNEAGRPTETHARYVEYANGDQMPEYMQPYYRGLLNSVPPDGMSYPPTNAPPDANGNFGYRTIQQRPQGLNPPVGHNSPWRWR